MVEDSEIKWKSFQQVDNFGEKLLSRLSEFCKNKIYYDLILKLEDAEICAHKVVLVACGGIFRKKLVDKESNQLRQDISQLDLTCSAIGLQPIIQFAYSGCLEITDCSLLPCLQAAQLLEQKEIENICIEMIKEHLEWIWKFNKDTKDHKFTELKSFLEANLKNIPKDFKKDEEMSPCCLHRVQTECPELVGTYFWILQILKPILDTKKKSVSDQIVPDIVVDLPKERNQTKSCSNPFGDEEEEDIEPQTKPRTSSVVSTASEELVVVKPAPKRPKSPSRRKNRAPPVPEGSYKSAPRVPPDGKSQTPPGSLQRNIRSKSLMKTPPPRPKPPAVKQKSKPKNEYDDKLNPFSIDEEE